MSEVQETAAARPKVLIVDDEAEITKELSKSISLLAAASLQFADFRFS